MRLKRRIYLIDVDNTLLDTEKLRKEIEKNLVKEFSGQINRDVFWAKYDTCIKKYGYNNVPELSEMIAKTYRLNDTKRISNLFFKADFNKCLNPKSLELISGLKKLGKVIIYSLGHGKYQLVKIRKSGIEKSVGKNNVIIVQDKEFGIKTILSKLNKDGYKHITIIDDKVSVLEAARKTGFNSFNIWLRYGKYKDFFPKNKLSVDFEARSLNEIEVVLKNFISKLDVPTDKFFLQIWKGITQKQKSQLFAYTKKDMLIQKFTHDNLRFKDDKSFNLWETKGKFLYTLTDLNQNLQGIIWFSKENFRKFDYTFAIRMYSTIRGKHLAAKFMRIVYDDFGSKSIWLKTLKENVTAQKLYKSFGFKTISEDSESIFMTYDRKF